MISTKNNNCLTKKFRTAPLLISPMLQTVFATVNYLLARIRTCQLKYSIWSKCTPSRLFYGRFNVSETDNSPCLMASVLPRSLSTRRREKCWSSAFSRSKVMPSFSIQGKASPSDSFSEMQLSYSDFWVLRIAMTSAYPNRREIDPNLKNGYILGINRIGMEGEPWGGYSP